MRRRSATSRSIRNAWPEKGPASVGPALKDACAIPGATGENLGGSERGWLVVVPVGARRIGGARRVGMRRERPKFWGRVAWGGGGLRDSSWATRPPPLTLPSPLRGEGS